MSPPTPLFLLFIVPPFFCSQLVCFALLIPLQSWMLLVFQAALSIFCACFSFSFDFLWQSSRQILTCPPLRLIFKLYYLIPCLYFFYVLTGDIHFKCKAALLKSYFECYFPHSKSLLFPVKKKKGKKKKYFEKERRDTLCFLKC